MSMTYLPPSLTSGTCTCGRPWLASMVAMVV
jgi:hypothetical protein